MCQHRTLILSEVSGVEPCDNFTRWDHYRGSIVDEFVALFLPLQVHSMQSEVYIRGRTVYEGFLDRRSRIGAMEVPPIFFYDGEYNSGRGKEFFKNKGGSGSMMSIYMDFVRLCDC